MALSKLESDTVSRALQVAKKILDEIKPVVDQLNIIYDSTGGAKTTITQQNLDTVPSFSGLTKAQLDDGLYQLTAVLRVDLANGLTQLAELAARA